MSLGKKIERKREEKVLKKRCRVKARAKKRRGKKVSSGKYSHKSKVRENSSEKKRGGGIGGEKMLPTTRKTN